MLSFDATHARRVVAAFVAALVLGARPGALGQQPATDLDARFADAQTAYKEQRWDAAAAAYASLRDLARLQGDEMWEARGLLGVGSADFERKRYVDARRELLAALKIFESRSDAALAGLANDVLARLALELGDDAESAARSRRAVAAFDAAGDRRARARAILRVERVAGMADRARLDRASSELLDDAESLRDADLECEVLHHWGDGLFTFGEYDLAIDKLETAASACEKGSEAAALATVYTSLGRLYRLHGQPMAAVKYQLKSLEIAERPDTSPRVHVQSLNAVAVAYEALGETAKAREYYERALAAAEKSGAPPLIDFMRANVGGFRLHQGDGAGAQKLLEEAVERAAEPLLSTRYDQLSSVYHLLGRDDDARRAAERALEECPRGTSIDCVWARVQLAEAQLGLADERAALATYQTALRSLEDVHARLAASDFLRQEFFHDWERFYSLGIELLMRRGEYREALESAELARSRAFLDLLASKSLAGIGRPVPVMPALTLRGAAATTIRTTALASAPNADELAAIAARLRSTMVVYWIAQDAAHLWVVSPEGHVSGTTVRVASSRLAALVRATSPFAPQTPRNASSPAAATRGDAAIAIAARRNPAWRELYDLLVKPIEAELPRTRGARLTIVPHGPLLHLPFAALRDGRGRYLVERYTIHSVPAAAVLQFTGERHRTNARAGRLLLVADPAAPPTVRGEPALPRLPGAASEADAIARLVPASRATVLADAAATESRVRAELPRRSVIHFATHAVVNDADPLSSFLALGVEHGGGGKLTAQKIYSLELDADLVVLSACRSGSGLVSGDGIASLARAFFYAGALSLVVSVWDVADAPTSRLVPAFYRSWLAGSDKAAALRAAQLALIRDLRAGRVTVNTPAGEVSIPEDPAFWAGFVLLGEPE